MKNLVLIVNAVVHQAIIDQLRALGVTRFTVAHVEGHDLASSADPFLSARDRVVGFVPRVRVDAVLPSEQAASILETLGRPSSGLAGHGIYWISPVERVGEF
ncbi:MAG: DUF3240 family protein [Planctomycetes bacterium]|nr:DUF3240 family protein [Planctomycetota bacterium]